MPTILIDLVGIARGSTSAGWWILSPYRRVGKMDKRILLASELDVKEPFVRPCRICWNPILGDVLPPRTKLITPPSRWANPFMAKVKARESADAHTASVARYQKWILSPQQGQLRSEVKRVLAGWNLACKCRVGSPCHGDVLLAIANDP
jgi:hypothetical protein